MDYDGYKLYELLKDGDPLTIHDQNSSYTMRFVGQPTGNQNYLSVLNGRGQEKRFGWGWGSEQVWRALEHLESGWDTPQRPPYRPYNAEAEKEVGGAFRYD